MIPCNEIDSLLIEYDEGNLGKVKRAEVEQHIESCTHCQAAWQEYKELFSLMESDALHQPSPMMDEKFKDLLLMESEIASSQSSSAKVMQLSNETKSFPAWLRVAASIILLAGGMLIGTQITQYKNTSNAQIASLNGEVKEIKEALMTTLLSNESASERLKAVSYTENMNQPDKEVISALIHTLNWDNNVNVRLAAAYSLDKFSSSQQVRDSLVASLSLQKEPVIQIVLINILAEHKEPKAIAPIRKILSDKESLQQVKDIAAKGLRVL